MSPKRVLWYAAATALLLSNPMLPQPKRRAVADM